MVAVKGKSSKLLNQIEDHATRKSVGVTNFKVYMEKDKAEDCSSGSIKARRKVSLVPPRRKSVTLNEGITQTITSVTSNYKGGTKTSENCKGKSDNSIRVNVGRKVLADVSNLRSNSLKTKEQYGSKQLLPAASSKGNTICSSSDHIMEKVKKNQRQTLADYATLKKETKVLKIFVDDARSKDQGNRVVSAGSRTTVRNTLPLPRKSLPASKLVSKDVTTASDEKGKVRGNRRQAVAGYPASTRGSKDFKLCVGDQRSKIQGHGFLTTDGRINARNPLPPMRKSLLLSKFPIQVDTVNKKATAENLEKGNGTYGFPVKPKVGRKVMPQFSNARAHLWRNHVSDGFISMASKNQTDVHGRAFPRKSAKPNVKTTYRTSSAKMTLNRKDKEVTSVSGKSATSVEGPHALREEASSGRRKSNRRKSFTSLLVARSKLLEETGQCMKQSLPSIYDDGNHLEVCEYVDEIYQYYWTMEAQNDYLVNYMAIQTEITPQMRSILVNWLIEVHLRFDLMQETLFLTITLLDRYLSLVIIKKNEMQLVGLTALLLASKYEDFWHPRVVDLISISVESYTRDQMLGMEKAILKKLKFRLAPTPYVFMLRFLKAAQSDKKLEDLSFYLIELCLVEYEALHFKPSLLCASAIYVARCTLQKTPAWTPLLCNHSHYEESQLRDCAEMVLKFQKSAKTSMLNVTFEKYSGSEYDAVAIIRPMNRLPLLN